MGVSSALKKFGKFIFNIKDEEKISYPVHEELIKKDRIIRAQQQQIQGREGQLAKVSADENKKLEEEKSKKYLDEITKRIAEKDEEIRARRFNYQFSLRFFLNACGGEKPYKRGKIYVKGPTEFGKEMDITDKDDKVIFGKLGDIKIIDNGYLAITDNKGDVLHIAKDFTQLIWKPDSLVNYMKRKRIPLAVDERLKPVIDFEELEVKDVIYDENEMILDEDGNAYIDQNSIPIRGTYKTTEELELPLRTLLQERDDRFRKLKTYTERLEKMNIDKDRKIEDIERALSIYKKRTEVDRTALSQALTESLEKDATFAARQKEIVYLTQWNAVLEVWKEKQSRIIEELLAKIEEYGDKTMRQKVKAEIKDDIHFYSNVLPEKQVIKEIEEVPPSIPLQPGEKVSGGRRG